MKQIISNSIDNIVSVMVADNLTTEQKMSLLEVMGTLQGFLILEDRWTKMYDKQAALDKLNTEPGEIENGAAAAEDSERWANEQAEQQNFDHEKNF